MDIVALWGHVPPLLDACSHGQQGAIRALRLVSKEASKVALLALRSYTLNLKSCCDGYKTVCGASLLRCTQLQELTVFLLLSGSFNPAILLEAFVRETRCALSTLTSLSLSLESTRFGGNASTVISAVLDRALAMLVSACPSLTTFTFQGHLSQAFLSVLGEGCPRLNGLHFVWTSAENHAHMKQVLLLQPSLLPQITTLSLHHWRGDYELPDMSGNHSITSLNLSSFKFETEEEWRCLPPNLEHLCCSHMETGPPAKAPAAAGRFLLKRLLTLALGGNPATLCLHDFAQLLHAAPAFQGLKIQSQPGDPSCILECFLHRSTAATTAAHLALMVQKSGLATVMDAAYSITGGGWEATKSRNPIILPLPRMVGVAQCRLICLSPGELGPLLRVFPNVTKLSLYVCHDMTDLELQEVAVCAQITTLRLSSCLKLSPVGVVSLCRRLPQLQEVVCSGCPLLEEAALEGCGKLLQLHGSLVRLVYKDDDDSDSDSDE